ncbi:hypothetical protein Taro_025876 [Colocasia esculenta]|uniref:Uncharacterized protein n=1 Tax=Colocasia esculenta TaxID=4460 RepID=A0A843VLU3_COLES|nr:hypothetical protein [Colocasia esculenta]
MYADHIILYRAYSDNEDLVVSRVLFPSGVKEDLVVSRVLFPSGVKEDLVVSRVLFRSGVKEDQLSWGDYSAEYLSAEQQERFTFVKTKVCGNKAVDVPNLEKNGMGSIEETLRRMQWMEIATFTESAAEQQAVAPVEQQQAEESVAEQQAAQSAAEQQAVAPAFQLESLTASVVEEEVADKASDSPTSIIGSILRNLVESALSS